MIGHNQPPHAGYILIFRQLLSHPVVGMMQPVKPADPKHPSASRLEAWLDLLMMAAYEDKTVKVNGHKYHLERGQNVCARAYLSERWNWSDKTVRAFLLKLEKHQMIDKSRAKKGQQANKVTICNYSQYQDGALQEGPSRGQQKGQYMGQKEGHKNTQLSDCKQKRIDFSGGGGGPTKGPAKGPIEGPQYKQIKPNKPKEEKINKKEFEPAKKIGRRLPEDWQPAKENWAWAEANLIMTTEQLKFETGNFVDYWLAAAGANARKLDWGRAWQTWMRRSNQNLVERQERNRLADQRYKNRINGGRISGRAIPGM